MANQIIWLQLCIGWPFIYLRRKNTCCNIPPNEPMGQNSSFLRFTELKCCSIWWDRWWMLNGSQRGSFANFHIAEISQGVLELSRLPPPTIVIIRMFTNKWTPATINMKPLHQPQVQHIFNTSLPVAWFWATQTRGAREGGAIWV